MADDKSKRGPADRARVNVHEQYELDHWTAHFKCSEGLLKQAVKEVGPMVKDVGPYIEKHR